METMTGDTCHHSIIYLHAELQTKWDRQQGLFCRVGTMLDETSLRTLNCSFRRACTQIGGNCRH
jgi:hypothetical protein